jgi:hypothetical protein
MAEVEREVRKLGRDTDFGEREMDKRERGVGFLKTLVVLLILAAAVYIAIKVVPAFVNNFQLEDAMKTEARFAAVGRKPAEEVRDAIYRKVRELGIPARRDDIQVVSSGVGLRIGLRYTVVVDLPGYQWKLEFNPSADSSSL